MAAPGRDNLIYAQKQTSPDAPSPSRGSQTFSPVRFASDVHLDKSKVAVPIASSPETVSWSQQDTSSCGVGLSGGRSEDKGRMKSSFQTGSKVVFLTFDRRSSLCRNQSFTAPSPSTRRLPDGGAVPVPHRSTAPGRPRHRREMAS